MYYDFNGEQLQLFISTPAVLVIKGGSATIWAIVSFRVMQEIQVNCSERGIYQIFHFVRNDTLLIIKVRFSASIIQTAEC